jgi:prolyl oligopeptidase
MDGGTMPELMEAPPFTPTEPVTEILHGVPVTDPYRWLEDQDSPRTREWLQQQRRYARAYLDSIPGRDRIRERIREFLAVETYDSLQRVGTRYFFRKRLPDQEQPCIYMREGADGEDQLLIDPGVRGTGKYTAVKPLRVSHDGRLLLYEVKEGGERTGTFELLEVESCKRLPDLLPRGYLRGFAFAPDCKSFYYVHEALGRERPFYRAAYQHVLGTTSSEDREVFFAGEDEKIRLGLTCDRTRIALFVHHLLERIVTDVYLKPFAAECAPEPVFRGITYMLAPQFMDEKIIALTDREAPNRRIVEIRLRKDGAHEWIDLIPECDMLITNWYVVGTSIFVSYRKDAIHRILVFALSGKRISEIPVGSDETIRMTGGSPDYDELLLERESFTQPVKIFRYFAKNNSRTLWARKTIPFDSSKYDHSQVWYSSKDGTRIPMFLVGRRDVLEGHNNPAIMTSYGGYGASMTPQFSVFVAFLMERGCLFALPNIRGGSEFGIEWHNAGRRRHRQTAYDDFLSAAEWLIDNGHTEPGRLAIFGGSNSGLLVGAAMTQRPDLFRAVVCMVPILDMLRYHLFDNAHLWKEEFGTSDDPDDFSALIKYSPYQQVREGVAYPATMIVSGDADGNCNPLHARKMTARLQAANSSERPILLDYSKFRGHSPVLPLNERINALTDRMAFLCDQLQLAV